MQAGKAPEERAAQEYLQSFEPRSDEAAFLAPQIVSRSRRSEAGRGLDRRVRRRRVQERFDHRALFGQRL